MTANIFPKNLDPLHSNVLALFQSEQTRRQNTISLTANENVISNTARALGSGKEYDRYYFNCQYQDNFRYSGNSNGMEVESFPEVDALKVCASNSAMTLFSTPFIEYRLLSGIHCTISSIASFTTTGQIVISIDEDSGGHFATSHIVEKLGRKSVNAKINKTEIDLDDLKKQIIPLIKSVGMVLIDHGMTTSPIPIKPLRDFLNNIGLNEVPIIYDASHTLGLIAGKIFPNPLDEGATLLQGNTHKSFPGPHRAITLTRDYEAYRKISESISKGLTSSPTLHSLIELFVSMLEMQYFSHDYAATMIKNAELMTDIFSAESHWRTEKTNTHIVLLQSNQSALAARHLNEFGIRLNNKQLNGRQFIRIGTQEITRLGINEHELKALCEIIIKISRGTGGQKDKNLLHDLAVKLQKVKFSFDNLD